MRTLILQFKSVCYRFCFELLLILNAVIEVSQESFRGLKGIIVTVVLISKKDPPGCWTNANVTYDAIYGV